MTMMQQYGLDRLSDEERERLIVELQDSLSVESDDWGLSEEQTRDLDERIAEDDADPDSGYTLEEIRARFKREP